MAFCPKIKASCTLAAALPRRPCSQPHITHACSRLAPCPCLHPGCAATCHTPLLLLSPLQALQGLQALGLGPASPEWAMVQARLVDHLQQLASDTQHAPAGLGGMQGQTHTPAAAAAPAPAASLPAAAARVGPPPPGPPSLPASAAAELRPAVGMGSGFGLPAHPAAAAHTAGSSMRPVPAGGPGARAGGGLYFPADEVLLEALANVASTAAAAALAAPHTAPTALSPLLLALPPACCAVLGRLQHAPRPAAASALGPAAAAPTSTPRPVAQAPSLVGSQPVQQALDLDLTTGGRLGLPSHSPAPLPQPWHNPPPGAEPLRSQPASPQPARPLTIHPAPHPCHSLPLAPPPCGPLLQHSRAPLPTQTPPPGSSPPDTACRSSNPDTARSSGNPDAAHGSSHPDITHRSSNPGTACSSSNPENARSSSSRSIQSLPHGARSGSSSAQRPTPLPGGAAQSAQWTAPASCAPRLLLSLSNLGALGRGSPFAEGAKLQVGGRVLDARRSRLSCGCWGLCWPRLLLLLLLLPLLLLTMMFMTITAFDRHAAFSGWWGACLGAWPYMDGGLPFIRHTGMCGTGMLHIGSHARDWHASLRLTCA